MKKTIKKSRNFKASSVITKSSISLNWIVIPIVLIIMLLGWYKFSTNIPTVAEVGSGSSVLDNYQYNTQKVLVTATKTGPKFTVVQQRTDGVGIDVKSDLEVAKNGAELLKTEAIKKAVKEGKSEEQAAAAGQTVYENSLHTSTAQIASGIASQDAIKNGATEKERAAVAAYAYGAVEKSLQNTNLTELINTGKTIPLSVGSSTTANGNGASSTAAAGTGSTCGGSESSIGDKQWAMLGDGTNKCVQCGGARSDGKGGPGVWGQDKVECGTGAASNYVAPIYQADKPKACWKDGTWFADTAGKSGNEQCLNGKWLDHSKYVAEKKAECAKMGNGNEYYFHEDHNACEKNNVAVVQCGIGFELKGGNCVSTNIAGQLGFQKRECEKNVGMVYNEKNGLCETSKVAPTKEQLIKAEVEHCKKLQLDTNTVGSHNWVSCSDEGKAAYQFCGDGFRADGNSACNLQQVTFGNSASLATTITDAPQNPSVSTAIQTGVGSSVGCSVGFVMSGPFGPIGCAVGTVVGGFMGNVVGNTAGNIARGDRTEADDVARTAADDVAPRQNGPVSTFFQVGTGVVSGCVAGSMVGLVPGCLAGAVVGGYVGNTAGNALGAMLNDGQNLPKEKIDKIKDESSATVEEGVLGTPDAPGQFGYDSVGAGTGALTMLAATAAPCTVPMLIPVVGIPLSLACRLGAAAGGALLGNKTGDYIYSWTH